MPTYKVHPLAEIFPPFTDKEFQDLVDDIGQNGQRNVITLFEGKILDGVHRYKACLKLNMEPKVRVYNGPDPLGFAVSANLKRRHLNESQRALIAAQLSGSKNEPSSAQRTTKGTLTNKEAAGVLNVSEHSVDIAKLVLKTAPKEDIAAIRSGAQTVRGVERKLKESKAKKEQITTDQVGRVIPDDLVAEWKRAEDTGKQLQSLARKIKSTVSKGFAGVKQDKLKDLIYGELTNSVISDAQALAWSLGAIIPYALCPTCQGRGRNSCALCRKRGWVSKFLWNSPAVNENVRKMIEKKAS